MLYSSQVLIFYGQLELYSLLMAGHRKGGATPASGVIQACAASAAQEELPRDGGEQAPQLGCMQCFDCGHRLNVAAMFPTMTSMCVADIAVAAAAIDYVPYILHAWHLALQVALLCMQA